MMMMSPSVTDIALYKPPVGLVTVGIVVWRVWRQLRPRQTRQLNEDGTSTTTVTKDSKSSDTTDQHDDDHHHEASSFDPRLTAQDEEYILYGGVWRIRYSLVLWTLTAIQRNRKMIEDDDKYADRNHDYTLLRRLENPLRRAVQLSTLASSNRTNTKRMLQASIEPLVRCEEIIHEHETTTASAITYDSREKEQEPQQPPQQIDPDIAKPGRDVVHQHKSELMKICYETIHVRHVHACLRLCRNRLLAKCQQLTSRVERQTHKVAAARKRHYFRPFPQSLYTILRSMQVLAFPSHFHDDNVDLQLDVDVADLNVLQGTLRKEMNRLDKIISILDDLPADFNETYLVQVLQHEEPSLNDPRSKAATTASLLGIEETGLPIFNRFSNIWQHLMDLGPALPSIFFFSTFWKRRPRHQSATQHENSTKGNKAAHLLISLANTEMARQWTKRAFDTLVDTVQQCFEESIACYTSLSEDEWTAMRRNLLLEVNKDSKTTLHGVPTIKSRESLLFAVNNLHTWRRLGEGPPKWNLWRSFEKHIRQLDWYGIPSSLLLVATARVVHEYAIPYWPGLRHQIAAAASKTLMIGRARFWEPVKGIWDDLMNKNQGIFSAFGLDVEETSLDHLLHDLGFGDGTPGTRHAALQQAAEQYERDVNSSMIIHTVQGRLPRLMLVQVQQLKVGLLSALDNIDVLLKGNRIHFQLLAIIPAILMATYGTQLFVRLVYNVRARDLRSVSSAHRDMEDYLNTAERVLRQASDEVKVHNNIDEVSGETQKHDTTKYGFGQTPKEGALPAALPVLAEVSLVSYRYLLSMEYTRGVFSEQSCHEIRILLQEVLKRTKAAPLRALSWLHLAQEKHKELLR